MPEKAKGKPRAQAAAAQGGICTENGSADQRLSCNQRAGKAPALHRAGQKSMDAMEKELLPSILRHFGNYQKHNVRKWKRAKGLMSEGEAQITRLFILM